MSKDLSKTQRAALKRTARELQHSNPGMRYTDALAYIAAKKEMPVPSAIVAVGDRSLAGGGALAPLEVGRAMARELASPNEGADVPGYWKVDNYLGAAMIGALARMEVSGEYDTGGAIATPERCAEEFYKLLDFPVGLERDNAIRACWKVGADGAAKVLQSGFSVEFLTGVKLAASWSPADVAGFIERAAVEFEREAEPELEEYGTLGSGPTWTSERMLLEAFGRILSIYELSIQAYALRPFGELDVLSRKSTSLELLEAMPVAISNGASWLAKSRELLRAAPTLSGGVENTIGSVLEYLANGSICMLGAFAFSALDSEQRRELSMPTREVILAIMEMIENYKHEYRAGLSKESAGVIWEPVAGVEVEYAVERLRAGEMEIACESVITVLWLAIQWASYAPALHAESIDNTNRHVRLLLLEVSPFDVRRSGDVRNALSTANPNLRNFEAFDEGVLGRLATELDEVAAREVVGGWSVQRGRGSQRDAASEGGGVLPLHANSVRGQRSDVVLAA
jgi:hypothetical protein